MDNFVKTKQAIKIVVMAGIISLMATMPAAAHVGDHSTSTFAHGLLHPFNGLDHVLAMIAVGLYAVQLGGRALWLVPAAFVGTMIVGALLGYLGAPMPMAEAGIALSVVAMGVAIAVGLRLPLIAATMLVGAFALFHGHAHGNEGLAIGMSFLPYAAGFIVATSLLHLSGIALGAGLNKLGSTPSFVLNKLAGTAGAIAGVSLLTGWLAA